MNTVKITSAVIAGALAAVVVHNSASPDVRHADDVSWAQAGPVLSQGRLGACTGFAVAGLLGKDGSTAIRIYTVATRIDKIKGEYPAKDTGSTVPAAMEAAKRLGLIRGYGQTASADEALKELTRHPLVVSLTWPFRPERHALIVLARRGDSVTLKNSWGPGFGDHGLFDMPVDTFKRIFNDAAYVG